MVTTPVRGLSSFSKLLPVVGGIATLTACGYTPHIVFARSLPGLTDRHEETAI